MNKKIKLILSITALVVGIAGSTVLYQNLSKNYTPKASLEPVSKEETSSENSDADSKSGSNAESEPVLAPDFSMEDVQGNTVNLSDFHGKPVVLNFWASWCPPCKEEMPDFEKVYGEKGDSIAFIMLNATDGARETKEKGKAFIAESGFTFPVYYDIGQKASYTYGVSSLPTTLFIDKDGYLITGSMGMLDEETLRRGIDMIQY